jgi:hypothetical protein
VCAAKPAVYMVHLSLVGSNVQLTGVKIVCFWLLKKPFIPQIHADSSLAF